METSQEQQPIAQAQPATLWDSEDAFWDPTITLDTTPLIQNHREGWDCNTDLKDNLNLNRLGISNLNQAQNIEMVKTLQNYLQFGHRWPLWSSYCSPVLFMKKLDGTIWFCIDYWSLNTCTKRDWYPLPNIQTIHSRLSKLHIVSKIHLRNAFHLLWIRISDEWKMAFAFLKAYTTFS
jgi:hypothetical protein